MAPQRLSEAPFLWSQWLQDMTRLRISYLKNAARNHPLESWDEVDIRFIAEDLKTSPEWVRQQMTGLEI